MGCGGGFSKPVGTRRRALRGNPHQKSDFWDFQARRDQAARPSGKPSPEIRLLGFPSPSGPGGAPFGETLTRNPTFGLCGRRAAGGGRRAVAPTLTPLVSTHPPTTTPKIAIPLLGGTNVIGPHGPTHSRNTPGKREIPYVCLLEGI
jgi:hypothetical protein